MKKNLQTILLERSETIEYRRIVKQLMDVAQNNLKNKKEFNSYRVLILEQSTLDRLRNEGINVEVIREFGCNKFLLTW